MVMRLMTMEQAANSDYEIISENQDMLDMETKDFSLFYRNKETGAVMLGFGGFEDQVMVTREEESPNGGKVRTKTQNYNFLKATTSGLGYKAKDLENYHGELYDTPYEDCTEYDLFPILLRLLKNKREKPTEDVMKLKVRQFYDREIMGDMTVQQLWDMEMGAQKAVEREVVMKRNADTLEKQKERRKLQMEKYDKVKVVANGKK